MRPCQQCFENNWSFKKIENIIRATCKNCGYEVEFETRNNKAKELKEGELCRKCGTTLILKKPKKHKVKAEYHYSAYYFCPGCKTMYMSDKFKVMRDLKPEIIAEPNNISAKNLVEGLIFFCDAGTKNNGQFGNQQTVVVVTDKSGKVLIAFIWATPVWPR